MTIIHSSDLGWTAGQNISDEFAALAKTFKPGDTFVFDHMYKISGSNIELPENFTLAGGAPGAGIDIIDSATNVNRLLVLNNGNTLTDLTVSHSNSPNVPLTDLNPKSGIHYDNKISILAEGDNIRILNSYFEGNVAVPLDVRGDNILIEDTEFSGAFYQVRLGGVDGATIHNSLFQNSLGDGIKTLSGGSDYTKNVLVSESVFLNNNRDGIDTTGGFKDSVVTDSYFVNNFSGLDVKSIYSVASDLAPGESTNNNILIRSSEFVNNTNAVVVSTEDRGNYLNAQNAKQYAAGNILIEDSIVEGNYTKMYLVKDSYDIHWNNVTLLGEVQEYRTISNLDIGLPQDVSGTGVTTGPSRGSPDGAYYQSLAGPDWSNTTYPTGGAVTPVDPVADPDPISYNPPVEPEPTPTKPEPVAEAPVEYSTPVASASNLLNIFVAHTDTDETISQLGAGSSIDGKLTDGRSLTIYATSRGDGAGIGSVRLTVDGVGSQLENVEPYALFGDDGNGDFFDGKQFSEGTYAVELVVFDGKNGSGNVLETVTFDFTVDSAESEPVVKPSEPVVADPVVEALVQDEPVQDTPLEEKPVAEVPVEPEPTPIEVIAPETDLAPDMIARAPDSLLSDIRLFDTNTDKALFDLRDGAKLSSSDLAGRMVTLSAEAINSDISIGSVRLELDGKYNRIENVEPYALFGDNAKGDFKGGIEIPDGTHSLTLTAYSGKQGKGSVLEQVTLNFEVGDYDSLMIDGGLSTVSSYSATQDTGIATVSNDQSSINLEGSAWKSLNLFGFITEKTVLSFDFESDAEGEIHGIGFTNEHGDLESAFFQLDGLQEIGIQDFNDAYETGSGSKSYIIPVGEYFTGSADQLVLVNDDDADLGAMSSFSNISLIEGIA
jgi:hypothetical protein